jgi:hypothetical protein
LFGIGIVGNEIGCILEEPTDGTTMSYSSGSPNTMSDLEVIVPSDTLSSTSL